MHSSCIFLQHDWLAYIRAPSLLPCCALQRNCLYVADTEAHALREVDLRKKTVRTLAGGWMQMYRQLCGVSCAMKG